MTTEVTVKEEQRVIRANPSNEMEQLQILIDSKSLPSNIKTIEQAWAMVQYGKEIGLKPMQAFHQIYSISGRLSLSSKALAGLMWTNGIQLKTTQDFELITKGQDKDGKDIKDRVTTIVFYRGKVEETASFYWSDAVKAGLKV